MKDFETWVNDFGTKHILRMLELRRPGQWTPYEVDQKFEDESLYKDIHYIRIQIKEAIRLPDNDVLVGYREIFDLEGMKENWEDSIIEYIKLSDIELSYFPIDDKENWN